MVAPTVLVSVDASPQYLWEYNGWRQVPGNQGLVEPRYLAAHAIQALVPQARILVLLREPVER